MQLEHCRHFGQVKNEQISGEKQGFCSQTSVNLPPLAPGRRPSYGYTGSSSGLSLGMVETQQSALLDLFINSTHQEATLYKQHGTDSKV